MGSLFVFPSGLSGQWAGRYSAEFSLLLFGVFVYCSHCGSKNDDGAGFCTQCGSALKAGVSAPQQVPSPQYGQPAPVYPANTTTVVYPPAPPAPAAPMPLIGYRPSPHLFLGILSTFCCGCFPLGLISLIFAIITISRNNAGDFERARGSSRQAAIWGWTALILGLLMVVAWAFWVFLFGGLEILRQMQQQQGW
jgi:hypothetical protein